MHLCSDRSLSKGINLALICLPLVLTACSFSTSSESSSDSSGSISDSASSVISSPSSASNKEKRYQKDVADYTMAYVKSSDPDADYNSYLKGVSDIAEKIGIANWDQNPKTYIAIGKGLKKAGVEGIAYETYKKNFAHYSQENMGHIQDGYDSEK
ncbi:MAG: putative lipoprotein [Methylicorpusculum sp.]|uniref:putative lipoprotein n=1 Tax=Methylicorpusculum sp. TaxID=2713644 RepID=UPI00271A35DB|nr:putative lipoprotein [Methylicorpusculum sp.]MDO8939026.1 putative lipoprotein [Methylicorpusculum sp.]MDP2201372.1 putative lipoprotein [Methylicorpusculum sp.]